MLKLLYLVCELYCLPDCWDEGFVAKSTEFITFPILLRFELGFSLKHYGMFLLAIGRTDGAPLAWGLERLNLGWFMRPL